MKRYSRAILVCMLQGIFTAALSAQASHNTLLTLSELSNTAFNGEFPEDAQEPTKFPKKMISWGQAHNALTLFMKCTLSHYKKSPWINQQGHSIVCPSLTNLFPFVQKLIVPKESQFYIWGDTHGSAHSLLRTLTYLQKQGVINDKLKIIKKNHYLVFLGDYVDRGVYSLEVLYVLMVLAIKNPDRVLLVRGNHEKYRTKEDDAAHTEKAKCARFAKEIAHAYPDKHKKRYQKLTQAFSAFPSAIFIGTPDKNNHVNYALLAHGGLDLGYTPHALFNTPRETEQCFQTIQTFNRSKTCKKLPRSIKKAIKKTKTELIKSPSLKKTWHIHPCRDFIPHNSHDPIAIGFMHYDFLTDSSSLTHFTGSKRWAFGKYFTKWLLNHYSNTQNTVRVILRGHQHNDKKMKLVSMRHLLKKHGGAAPLWGNNSTIQDNQVFTLVSAPASSIDVPFDSFCTLTVNPAFNDWKLTHTTGATPYGAMETKHLKRTE